jgi:thiopeptide-type bacteriocin biosynthesis protein
MPADHLITISPYQTAVSVLAVLGGADLESTATDSGLESADLHEALQIYQAAGLAALGQRAERDWYQVRVQFPDWTTAERTVATRLGPRLDQLHAHRAQAEWWFLRKHPCWRLRLLGTDTTAVDHVLDELTEAGLLTRWRPSIYEPETTAFGGPAGMRTAHELFCADSRGVLDYARQPAPALGRRELSTLLISALLQSAGLDWFEHGDVFARVAQLRPAPADSDVTRVDGLADSLRAVLTAPAQTNSALFAPHGPVAFAAPWLAAFQNAGRDLGDAAAQGKLNRGLRAVLTHVLIFHWNRLGLAATTQGVLARAATAAILPRS